MDVAATGVFSPMERTFFDVRVTHPNAPSNRSIPPSKLYVRHEMEKKVKYEERIIQIEKGSFCPLIFSTSGGVGPLCDNVHKKLAGRIAIKRKENYGDVILKISLLTSALGSSLKPRFMRLNQRIFMDIFELKYCFTNF